MSPEEFRRQGHRIVDWLAEYFASPDRYPVLSQVAPGDVAHALPAAAPEQGEPFDAIFEDFERVIVPGLTHWNHPGFFAYFAISGSGPGVLAEMLAAGLNVQAMLWRTSPSATELEAVSLGWLRELIGLPSEFEGVIYDTASVSTLHALAAARERVVPEIRTRGMAGRPDLPAPRVYCSDHTHSSIDKAVLLLGLGRNAIHRVEVDASHAMRPDRLADAIAADRRAGSVPLAVVATVGTTSSTAIDPVAAIADVCQAEGVWLHVDAAYAGVMAMVPAWRHILDGAARADSLVVNPHKWLFTPFDLERALLPADGRRAAGVLAGRGVPGDKRRSRGQEPHGHRHPARTTVPVVETVDGAPLLRRRRDPPAARGACQAGPPVCRLRRRRSSLGAAGARPVQRGVLPVSPGGNG